jgi:cell surface protein SprA
MMHLKERPFTQKVNIGDDPISNTIYGFDFNYNTQSRFLTWLVDKLPLYQTKEVSSFTAAGEAAYLKPGYNKVIGKDGGLVYVDDFEGTSNSLDLRFPANAWVLASTPRGALDRRGNVLFPEAELIDDLQYGFNRAKLAWYNIDPLFLRSNTQTPDYIADDNVIYLFLIPDIARRLSQNTDYFTTPLTNFYLDEAEKTARFDGSRTR